MNKFLPSDPSRPAQCEIHKRDFNKATVVTVGGVALEDSHGNRSSRELTDQGGGASAFAGRDHCFATSAKSIAGMSSTRWEILKQEIQSSSHFHLEYFLPPKSPHESPVPTSKCLQTACSQLANAPSQEWARLRLEAKSTQVRREVEGGQPPDVGCI